MTGLARNRREFLRGSLFLAGGALCTPALSAGSGALFAEDFRVSRNDNDDDVINAALSAARHGSKVVLERGREYRIGGTIWLPRLHDLEIDFNGAFVRRAAEADVTATSVSKFRFEDTLINLDRIPENWRVGDRLFAISGGNADRNVSRLPVVIRSIRSDGVELSSGFGDTLFPQAYGHYPRGTLISKSFSMFEGAPSFGADAFVNERMLIHGGTIDGAGSSFSNHSWLWNYGLYLNGNACAIRDMHFRDMPAECIVGHGMRISECHFTDLAGSAFHTSVHDETLAQTSISIFSRNIVQRVNQLGNEVMGHSEGAITFSWNGGRIIVTENEFSDGGAALLGVVARPQPANTRHDFVIANNICRNFNRVFHDINPESDRVVVTGNLFVNCGNNGVLFTALSENSTVVIANNIAAGNTVLVRGALSQDDQAVLAIQ